MSLSIAELLLFKEIGIAASRMAETALLENFGKISILSEKANGDWLTEADIHANQVIRDAIQSAQPGVAIFSEEDSTEALSLKKPTWIIDPLDGTHNFILGVPVFGIALTLVVDYEPILAIVNQPVAKHLFVAVKGQGTTLNGRFLPEASIQRDDNHLGTLCYVLGYESRRHNFADSLLLQFRAESKRVLELWAPSLSWCLVAQQRVDSIICIAHGEFDTIGGPLLLREAGGIVTHFDLRISTGESFPVLVGSTSPRVQDRVMEIIRNSAYLITVGGAGAHTHQANL